MRTPSLTHAKKLADRAAAKNREAWIVKEWLVNPHGWHGQHDQEYEPIPFSQWLDESRDAGAPISYAYVAHR